MKICPHCNTQLADNARFCPKCGQNLLPPSPPNQTPYTQYQQPVAPRKNNNTVIIIISAALAVIVVICICFALFMGRTTEQPVAAVETIRIVTETQTEAPVTPTQPEHRPSSKSTLASFTRGRSSTAAYYHLGSNWRSDYAHLLNGAVNLQGGGLYGTIDAALLPDGSVIGRHTDPAGNQQDINGFVNASGALYLRVGHDKNMAWYGLQPAGVNGNTYSLSGTYKKGNSELSEYWNITVN